MDETREEVSARDRSYLYGDGLFETVRVREDGAVRWLERHVDRLVASARALGYPDAHVELGVEALRSLGEKKPGLWRVTVSRSPDGAPFGGEGSVRLRHRPYSPPERPRLTFARGFYLPDDPLAEHKTTSFLRWLEARRAAVERGFDDAVLVSGGGLVGEASCANLVAVIDRQPVTPPVCGILPGVTRRGILELADEHGEPLEVRQITVEELNRADEIALLSAGVGILAAESLEGRALEDTWTRRAEGWLP